ncbi:hypothetical protein [Actinoplanes solisilvae]|uniref:hypothetical protein n=1 Tax=Actinoplanes solisilvae TaxID=2486853 RepID=UPI000FDB2D64|nr:hypothetical protein [Actinoplanes solisilvae]
MDPLIVIVFVMLIMRVVGAVVVARVQRARQRPHPPAVAVDPCLSSLFALPPTPDPDPEKSLLARLSSGKIDQEHYRTAMAGLACRDDSVHPLRAP